MNFLASKHVFNYSAKSCPNALAKGSKVGRKLLVENDSNNFSLESTAKDKERFKNSKRRTYGSLDFVKRFISNLSMETMFTTRELLPLVQYRSVLDTFLSRAVKSGYLERLARGVFRVSTRITRFVTDEEIVAVKRKSFNNLVLTTEKSRTELKIVTTRKPKPDVPCVMRQPEFQTLGTQTSLQTNLVNLLDTVNGAKYVQCSSKILLRPIGNRKAALGETRVGRILREIWDKGKGKTTKEEIQEICGRLRREERIELVKLRKFIPQWLSEMLPKAPAAALYRILEETHKKKSRSRRFSL